MQGRSSQHLERTERNRAVAYEIADPETPSKLEPPPLEWGVVAAFYAAVHFVNAYSWEHGPGDPGSHQNRVALVATDPALSPMRRSYIRLQDRAYAARYNAEFRIAEVDFRDLLRADLEAVREAINRAVGVDGEPTVG